MRLKLLAGGLTLAFLTACATPSAPTRQVPDQWIDPVARPELQGPLNADLARAYKARGDAIDKLNADRASIREWNRGP